MPVSEMEAVLGPLRDARRDFNKILEVLADHLTIQDRSSVFSQFALHALARIPPTKLHPSSVMPLLDTFWGPDERHLHVLTSYQAAEQLITDAATRGVEKLLHAAGNHEAMPDTSEWSSLFALLAVKRSYCSLSPEESAVYHALAKVWYATDIFTNAPRLVPLTAKLSLAQLVRDKGERENAIKQLSFESSLYFMAPNDPVVREVLRSAEGKIRRLSREDRKLLANRFDIASVTPPDSILGSLIDRWPQPEGETTKDILSTLRNRALVAIQSIEIFCHKEGYIDSISIEEALGQFVDRQAAWVSIELRDVFPPEMMADRNFSTHSHGLAFGNASIERERRVCVVQEKLVEQYLDFMAYGDPRAFSSDAELAAECQLSEERVGRYITMIARAPWFKRILEIRQDTLRTTPPRNERQPSERTSSAPAIMRVASGCRYRDEFFDSQSEGAVGILLEKYLSNFRVSRGATFQVPVRGKRLDFFLGEIEGSPHFLEYHPIVLGRPGFRHDFASDEEARAFYDQHRTASPSERASLVRKTKERLTNEYAADRLALATDHKPGAVLHHIQNADELYNLLTTLGAEGTMPDRALFHREFDELVAALGVLTFTESIVSEALEREYPAHYNRDWSAAAADSISRPVRYGETIQHHAEKPLPVVTSFAHRTQSRLVEVVVSRLFDTSLQIGRPDDHFYASREDFERELQARGYALLPISSESINSMTVARIAHQIACFLCDNILAPHTPEPERADLGDDLLPKYWVGSAFESFSASPGVV
jgi:hypothetical protein